MRTKYLVFLLMFFLFSKKIPASDNEVILKKIEDIDKRLSKLEKMLSPFEEELKGEARQKIYRKKFNERNRKDKERFSDTDSIMIEKLYQVANKDWKSEEAQKNIEELIQKYPGHNRTGCAILYLGQWLQGGNAKKYLKLAIEKYDDSFYGDGVQVGAYARFILAKQYKSENNEDEANKILNELKSNYPDAIDHSGNFLSDLIETNESGKICSEQIVDLNFNYENENEKIKDNSQNPNSIEINNISLDNGIYGKCAKFNGKNSYLLIKNSNSIKSISTGITISLWFNAFSFYSGQNNVNSLLRKNIEGGRENFFIRFRITNGKPYIEFNLGRNVGYIKSDCAVDINKWYHLVGIYNGNELLIFLNGKEIGRKEVLTKNIICDNSDIYIGKGDENYSHGEYFHGLIDEIKIYNYGLTSEQIIEQYNKIIKRK